MNLAQQLEKEEGRKRSAYTDSEGYLTIGIGRLIDARKGGSLSNVEIDFLLANDIAAKTAEVLKFLPWVATLDEVRKAVIIGIAFQLGTNGLLGFPAMLAALKRGDWSAAAAEMLDSKWAKQTPERVERLFKQMRTGLWPVYA